MELETNIDQLLEKKLRITTGSYEEMYVYASKLIFTGSFHGRLRNSWNLYLYPIEGQKIFFIFFCLVVDSLKT